MNKNILSKLQNAFNKDPGMRSKKIDIISRNDDSSTQGTSTDNNGKFSL